MTHRRNTQKKPARSSFTKQGDIYISPCNTTAPLFPLQEPPISWSSCGDAYEFTWLSDFDSDLAALAEKDRLKLARSMGFCPQNRCQLSNVSSAADDNICPENLCYTKIENGGKSYGACCFTDGQFNSGNMIGFYNKTQHTPKPIYKHSRIVLGDILTRSVSSMHRTSSSSGSSSSVSSRHESSEYFINANILFDGLIATQCPLPATAADVAQMIVEQNVSLWIQLAPHWPSADAFIATAATTDTIADSNDDEAVDAVAAVDAEAAYRPTEASRCMVYPNAYLHLASSSSNSNNYSSNNRSNSSSSSEWSSSNYLWFSDFHRLGSGMVGLPSSAFLAQSFHIDYFSTAPHVVYKRSLAPPATAVASTSPATSSVATDSTMATHSGSKLQSTATTASVNNRNSSSEDRLLWEAGISSEFFDADFSDTSAAADNLLQSNYQLSYQQQQQNHHQQQQIQLEQEQQQQQEQIQQQQQQRRLEALQLYGRNFTQRVEHIWYHQWRDFQLPRDEDREYVLAVADRAAAVISQGGTVAVSCLSGRGRTGTFAALVAGRLHRSSSKSSSSKSIGSSSHSDVSSSSHSSSGSSSIGGGSFRSNSELIDAIVQMRENRDGIVETPQQFRFVAESLELRSPADCGLLCQSQQHAAAAPEAQRLLLAFLLGLLLVLVPVLFMFKRQAV